MRAYVPSPDLNRPTDCKVPLVIITTTDNVCSDDAYNVRFPGPDNTYDTALTLTFTDDDADEFLEAFAAARLKRLMVQEQAYEALRAKFDGPWDNTLAQASGHDDYDLDAPDADRDGE